MSIIKLSEDEKREMARRVKLVSEQPPMTYEEVVEQVKRLRASSKRRRPESEQESKRQ